MRTKTLLIIILAVAVLQLCAGAVLYPRFTDHMATHWNDLGEANGYGTRFTGLFLMPLITLGVALLLALIPAIDPLKANIQKFRPAYNGMVLVFLAFMVYLHKITLAWNLGWRFNMNTMIVPAMGLLFIYIGYLLRQAKRNWFIGIRTPWTLSSDVVWDKTHRLAGPLFIAAGILAILGVFVPDLALILLMAPVILSALFLVVYSYLMYREEEKKVGGGA